MFLVLLAPGFAAGQVQIVAPAEGAVTSLNRAAVTVRSLPGAIVQLSVNGTAVKRDTVRIDGLLDFLNVEVPAGDVEFSVGMVSDQGTVSLAAKRSIHVLGPPAVIVIEPGQKELSADGASSTPVAVKLYDEWKVQINDGYTVTVDADSGTVTAEDLDPARNGVQLRVIDGAARFTYVAGRCSGTARLKASVGDRQASADVELNTPIESFTLVGLATGSGQAASAGGDRSNVISSDSYRDGVATDGRLALYARGTVLKDYRLTLSYDTDRRNSGRLYRDLDPDYLYSIYGDNSMLTYDAQTTRQLYARLERNRNFLLLGDFNTDMMKQEFTLYNRSLYGLKGGYEENGWKVQGFGSLTDRQAVQLEIRGTGLSGLYDLGYVNVTPGSEKIRVETRDRFHSEILLKQVDQYRFSDYEIDYSQGTVFFKQPVPAIDGQGNPVHIVVSFEAYDGSKKSYLAGARAEKAIGEHLVLGVNGVVEEQQPSNYSLLGADASYKVGEQLSLNGEIGRSGHYTGSGLAYKIEASASPVDALTLRGYYRQVDKGFFNITQSGTGREVGTKKHGLSGSYQLTPTTKLSADYYRSFQGSQLNDVTLNSLSGSLEQRFSQQLNGSVSMEELKYDAASSDTTKASMTKHSLLATGRLSYLLSDRLTLSVQRDQNLGSDIDITRPSSTSLIGEYRVAEPVTLQAQEKFCSDGGSLSSFGVVATPLEGTSVSSRYEVGNAIGQHRNMLSIGLKNRLRLPLDLTANFGFERARSLEHRLGEASTDDHTAVSGSLEFLPKDPIKATLKAEYGEDAQRRKSNYTMGVDYRLMNDVSMIWKYLLAFDDAVTNPGYQVREHLILGAAYRPVESDILNVIGKFEEKRDDNHYLEPFVDSRASIVSVHAFFEPVRRVEVGVKYAYKYGIDRSPGFASVSHTNFCLFDLRYDLSSSFDIGAEYRLLKQTESRDWLVGYHAEIGYAAVKNVRVAAGYNFKGYKEQDLVDYSLWSKGPFVRVNFKFDEGLFGL